MKLTYERAVEIPEIFANIKSHYGISKFYEGNFPQLVITYDPSTTHYGDFGLNEWGEPTVTVNVALCPRMVTIIQTLIEEYIHYLQSPSWYTRYARMYSYWKNPYEIDAKKIAKRDWRLFK